MQIILTAHGHCASSLLEAVEMILGPTPDFISAVDFGPNDTIDVLTAKLSEKLDDTNCYIFCDIKGGSPFNAAYLLSKEHKISIICGMNLGMILECLINYINQSEISMIETAQNAGKAAIETFEFQ